MDLNEKFEQMDLTNEKLLRIINCAYHEFSTNSFEKASTNNIVKQAQVSRGLLYHYFEDKQELFDFLVFYSYKIMSENMKNNINWEETDYINRLLDGVKVKMQVMVKHPYLIAFYQSLGDYTDVRKKTESTRSEFAEDIKKRFYTDNVDFSNLKPGVDREKMQNVIMWTLREIGIEFWNASHQKGEELDLDALVEKYKEYAEFLRGLFFN